TTVAEIFPADLPSPSELNNASSSIELPASAASEGTRTVCPSSTTNCLPPDLIIACDIFFYLSDGANTHRKVEHYRGHGSKRQPCGRRTLSLGRSLRRLPQPRLYDRCERGSTP